MNKLGIFWVNNVNNNYRIYAFVIILILIFINLTGLLPVKSDVVNNPLSTRSKSKTLYVGGNGSGNYTNIQDAINDSIEGDTVYVYNGTYYENLIINKSIDLIGKDRETTKIVEKDYGNVITLIANWVNVSGFTISNGCNGIKIESSSNNNIINNNISTGNWIGIKIESSSNNRITNNTISSNNYWGVLLESSNNNIIENNLITNHRDDSDDTGLVLRSSSNNTIIKNEIIDNDYGISLGKESNDNRLIDNNIVLNDWSFYISYSKNNIVMNNNISETWKGLDLYRSSQNFVVNNNIYTNGHWTIFLEKSSNNTIFHNNIIRGSSEPYDDTYNNSWNMNYPIGGNYWSSYLSEDFFKGPNQDIPGSDGIVDKPFNIIKGCNCTKDQYPLTKPINLDNFSSIPSQPRYLKGTTGDGYVNLKWESPIYDGNSIINNFLIYRGTSSDGKILLYETGNINSYNDTTVINGVAYYYVVYAKKSNAISPPSKEIIIVPGLLPSEPVNFSAFVGDSFVKLTWDKPVLMGSYKIIGYSIYKNLSTSIKISKIEIGNSTSFLDEDVENGLIYYYRISATNLIGEGPMSKELAATPNNPFDLDNDFIDDKWESEYGLNSTDPRDAQLDPDKDGLACHT